MPRAGRGRVGHPLGEKTAGGFNRIYILIQATWEEAVRIFPPKSVYTLVLSEREHKSGWLPEDFNG